MRTLTSALKKQLQTFLQTHPDVPAVWLGEQLTIEHPNGKPEGQTTITFEGKRVTLDYGNKQYRFARKWRQSATAKASEILQFWLHELFSLPMRELAKPALENHQYTLLQMSAQTGQVLTVGGHLFCGWGSCYLVFNSLDDARNQARISASKQLEWAIFDAQYALVETSYPSHN